MGILFDVIRKKKLLGMEKWARIKIGKKAFQRTCSSRFFCS